MVVFLSLLFLISNLVYFHPFGSEFFLSKIIFTLCVYQLFVTIHITLEKLAHVCLLFVVCILLQHPCYFLVYVLISRYFMHDYRLSIHPFNAPYVITQLIQSINQHFPLSIKMCYVWLSCSQELTLAQMLPMA